MPASSVGHLESMVGELQRQVDTLVERGYPALAGLSDHAFRASLAPLAERLAELPPSRSDLTSPTLVPFVLVIARGLVALDAQVRLIERRGKPAYTDVRPEDLARFLPLDDLVLPRGATYVVTGVDAGADTRHVTPDAALERVTHAGRSPLTLEEGIALATHFPHVLAPGNGFSLLGSRSGDRRVLALWVMKGGAPRLGWCWAGNPHTWLGSASCAVRVGGDPG